MYSYFCSVHSLCNIYQLSINLKKKNIVLAFPRLPAVWSVLALYTSSVTQVRDLGEGRDMKFHVFELRMKVKDHYSYVPNSRAVAKRKPTDLNGILNLSRIRVRRLFKHFQEPYFENSRTSVL